MSEGLISPVPGFAWTATRAEAWPAISLSSLPSIPVPSYDSPARGRSHSTLQVDPLGSPGLTTGPSKQPCSKYLQLPTPHSDSWSQPWDSARPTPSSEKGSHHQRPACGCSFSLSCAPRCQGRLRASCASKSQTACGRPSRPEASSFPPGAGELC